MFKILDGFKHGFYGGSGDAKSEQTNKGNDVDDAVEAAAKVVGKDGYCPALTARVI